MKKVCVVGTGYVGLVTGACLAELENEVVCLDVDAAKIESLRAGVMPIFEPGLDRLVSRNVSKGRLSFTTSYEDAVRDADYCFIAVNTPSKDDGSADMTYVKRAAGSIGEHATRDIIIVNKSTMPVGSGDEVSAIAHMNLRDRTIKVSVVSNPEFLREGSAVKDFQQPDRVVLGSNDQAAARRVGELYVPLRAPIVITDLPTAEMIKYAFQRLPRHQDLLHQRDGAHLRPVRRGCQRGRGGHGLRQAHRSRLPRRWPWLRRKLL
ncbi:MAG: nucleotide sugar dehydrogenase [Ktedonobacterales bacterium]